MSTINWLVVLMPVYGKRNGLHLVPLRWKKIVDGAGDKWTEVRANLSGRNANSPGTI